MIQSLSKVRATSVLTSQPAQLHKKAHMELVDTECVADLDGAHDLAQTIKF